MTSFSPLPKTWLLDIDGTILKHNGYLSGKDEVLPGVKEFFEKISPNDKIILLTSREKIYQKDLERFLHNAGIRYDLVLYDLPVGERILINDRKVSGLATAFAINKKRDEKLNFSWTINEDL